MRDLQEEVQAFNREHHTNTDPEWHALSVVSEMGEVAKEILRITDYGKRSPRTVGELENELGDVLFSLISLANTYNISIEEALRKALKKNNKKKYLHGRLSSSFY